MEAIFQRPMCRRQRVVVSIFDLGRHGLALFLSLILLAGPAILSARSADRKIRATTTVTMVSDLVQQVGGDRVEVQGLMGPGVDPHLYNAAASDVTKLQQADVIFYSGLLLEGKMQDVLA